ncbi:MAG: NAD(P)/FAD-dependent oxidoreductase [Candidatus Dormibacteria bacterium]
MNWNFHTVLDDGTAVAFDHLVLATGAATARLRGRVISELERAAADRGSAPRLRVVVAGGDLAGRGAGKRAAQLAEPVIQAGKHVARQPVRISRELPAESFSYRDCGTMATIGRRAAVAQLRAGVRLTVTVAWLAWLGLHLVELLGGRNWLLVLFNWT